MTPVSVSGVNGLISIAAGSAHAVALKSDGTVWTWGANGNGQLGDGTTNPLRSSPVMAYGLSGVAHVGAGYKHSLAVRQDGTIWVWGDNQYHQLGNAPLSPYCWSWPCSVQPSQLSGISDVVAVAGGEWYSLALRADGTLWAWGDNSYGQLGINNVGIVSSSSPVQVQGLTGVTAMAAGGHHALAVRNDGTVWGGAAMSGVRLAMAVRPGGMRQSRL
jgi:alpha-tubulin suppressor-like RCC1 family protein